MTRPVRRDDGWWLCLCAECQTGNYCAPGGNRARCRVCRRVTYHSHIPYALLDAQNQYTEKERDAQS